MNYLNEIKTVKAEIANLELRLAHLEKMQAIKDQLEAETMTLKEKMTRFTIKAAAKLTGKTVEFKDKSNSTVRFTLSNKHGKATQGFYRIRVKQDRSLELQTGDTFTQLHKGKVTIALETAAVRNAWNFAVSAK